MTLFNYRTFSVAVLLMFSCAPAIVFSHDHQVMPKYKMASDIMVHGPWSRALPPVATNGAVYLMVHNRGQSIDTILDIKSPIADSVMMHQSVATNGNVTMKHVTQLVIKPREMVQFKPGGYHVMLMGLNKPLVAGESFPITIVMEKAGEINAIVKIKHSNGDSTTQSPPKSSHHH